jgi:hypothetical protein
MIAEAFAIRNQLLSGSDASIDAMTERLGITHAARRPRRVRKCRTLGTLVEPYVVNCQELPLDVPPGSPAITCLRSHVVRHFTIRRQR